MQIQFPGFFDLQVNGFAGVDFNHPVTPEAVQLAVSRLKQTGVTRFLPTLITSTTAHFANCSQALTDNWSETFAGIHMEGPWISPEDGPRGAHNLAAVCEADQDDFKRRQEAAHGRIVLVTLAPEVAGALKMIDFLTSQGIRVALGHTNAQPATIRDAISAGAVLSTHLGNGCPGFLPRHPNLIWEQLASDSLLASLIVDGHHLPPATVKSMIRAKSKGRVLLITDAISAAGRPPGNYHLGDLEVELTGDGRVAPKGKPWLAGSALTMPQAVANTVRFTGLLINDVLPMASVQPADFLGQTPMGTVTADWNQEACELKIIEVS